MVGLADNVREIRHVLEMQAARLDHLAAEGARARQPNWRDLSQAAHNLG